MCLFIVILLSIRIRLVMEFQLGTIDTSILIIYGIILVGMGAYFFRKSKTSEQFMVAGRGIPAWAAGLAVMSAYTSSISYIAVPGKAFDSNWHPLIFALLLINAKSALDIWWIIAGIFGGGILGLFLLSIFNIKITQTQGIVSVIFSILIIIWGSFFRNLPDNYSWLECNIDPIIIGAMSTTGLVLLALLFVVVNKSKLMTS